MLLAHVVSWLTIRLFDFSGMRANIGWTQTVNYLQQSLCGFWRVLVPICVSSWHIKNSLVDYTPVSLWEVLNCTELISHQKILYAGSVNSCVWSRYHKHRYFQPYFRSTAQWKVMYPCKTTWTRTTSKPSKKKKRILLELWLTVHQNIKTRPENLCKVDSKKPCTIHLMHHRAGNWARMYSIL